jgi:hypothetical protein
MILQRPTVAKHLKLRTADADVPELAFAHLAQHPAIVDCFPTRRDDGIESRGHIAQRLCDFVHPSTKSE